MTKLKTFRFGLEQDGLPEAPADGRQYARQDEAWTKVTDVGEAIREALSDSVTGTRKAAEGIGASEYAVGVVNGRAEAAQSQAEAAREEATAAQSEAATARDEAATALSKADGAGQAAMHALQTAQNAQNTAEAAKDLAGEAGQAAGSAQASVAALSDALAGLASSGEDAGAVAASLASHAATVGSASVFGHIKLGTAAGTACAGNDARLSNARAPTAHKASHATGGSDALSAEDVGAAAASHTTPAATANACGHVKPGTGLSVDANGALSVSYGTAAGTACQGNDARLSNARTPAAHKASHATGGSDALSPADIGAAAANHTTPAATASACGHVKPGTGLAVDTAGTLTVKYGTAAGTACQGNDARLLAARMGTLTGDAGKSASTLPAGTADELLLVPKLGLFGFNAASTEPVDGETVIKPASGAGRWELVLPAPEFVLATIAAERQKPLTASAELSFPAIAARASAVLTIPIHFTADYNDMVTLTPPEGLAESLVYAGYIQSPDLVAVRLTNVGAAAVTPAAAEWTATVYRRG